jgi:hypothetical protein
MKMFTALLRSLMCGLVLLAAVSTISGCGGYTLRGKVVRGSVSSIEMVHEVDERLKAPGIANAEVRVLRDPNTLNRHLAGQTRSGGEGHFATSIPDFGAGWMQEQWLVQCTLSGHQNAEQLMKLPAKGSKWRVLITLAPGTATPTEADDFMQDYEKFK